MLDSCAVCAIGIGNPDCGDDAAGPETVDRLQARGLPGLKAIKSGGETAGLIEILGAHKKVILIDAIASVNDPGRIHRFDASEKPLPSEWFSTYSTHSMGVHEAVEMARALGELPETVIVYGIEGRQFEAGSSMSEAVKENLDNFAQTIEQDLTQYLIPS